jgi:hypothetical protein
MHGLASKFSNPVFHHLIKLMDLFLEIGFLPFFEEHLLIMGRSLQRTSSGERRLYGRRKIYPYTFLKEIFSLLGAPY